MIIAQWMPADGDLRGSSRRPASAHPTSGRPVHAATSIGGPCSVEYLRFAVTRQRRFDRFNADVCFHGDRHTPGQQSAAEPVQHHHEVNDPARDRDVRDVRRPDLFGPGPCHATHQIRVDAVPRPRFAGSLPAVTSLVAHPAHQRPPDHDPFVRQHRAHHPVVRGGVIEMLFVDPPHDRQVGRGHWPRRAIARRTRYTNLLRQ